LTGTSLPASKPFNATGLGPETEWAAGSDDFEATETHVATPSATFTASDTFIQTAPLPASRLFDRSGFFSTRMPETSREDSSGSGKVAGIGWLTIVAIAAAAVALLIAILAAWRIAKCAHEHSDLPQASSEGMQTEERTAFTSFTHEMSAVYYENPNELETIEILDSDGLATDLVESEPAIMDDPDELL
jgi:hypothetical protein